MSADEEAWWEGFFSGPFDGAMRAAADPESTRRAAERIAALLDLRDDAEVLDAPCGEGRIAVELAAMGFRVTGFDLQERYLARARDVAASRGLSVRLERGDVRSMPYEGAFDAVVCFWSSIGYFDDAGNDAQLQGYARALRPGGRLLVDTQSLETLLPRFQTNSWWRLGDRLVLEERRYDPLSGRVHAEWLFPEEGGSRAGQSAIRVFGCAELVDKLRAAGFVDFAVWGGLEGEAFGIGARRLVLVARSG